VAAVAVVSLVAWNVIRLAQGKVTASELACVDPTDPCNRSAYKVANDTRQPIVLRECSHHCGRGDREGDAVRVLPGESTQSSVDVVSALVGGREWWSVRVRGHRDGCLVLDGHEHKRDGDIVRVSAARPCRENAPNTPAVRA
jgi:hypothetical protein